jgi:hypothetical protein
MPPGDGTRLSFSCVAGVAVTDQRADGRAE